MGMKMARWLSVLSSYACPLLLLALLSDPKGFSILTLVVLTRASRSLSPHPPRPKLPMSMTPPQPLPFIFANRASSRVAHVRSSQQCSHCTHPLSHSCRPKPQRQSVVRHHWRQYGRCVQDRGMWGPNPSGGRHSGLRPGASSVQPRGAGVRRRHASQERYYSDNSQGMCVPCSTRLSSRTPPPSSVLCLH